MLHCNMAFVDWNARALSQRRQHRDLIQLKNAREFLLFREYLDESLSAREAPLRTADPLSRRRVGSPDRMPPPTG
jgi:hypothetical protein